MDIYFGYYQTQGIYLIKADQLYHRQGNPYHDDKQIDWPDNFLRFALLGWIASELAAGLDQHWQPDIVHAHDWHAGLADRKSVV